MWAGSYLCIAVFTLDAGLLARSQYSEGPATGHLDTGFSRFPCVYKQMLRRFPTLQVATTCISCSPSDSTNRFHVLYTCKITTASGWQPNYSLLLLLLLLLLYHMSFTYLVKGEMSNFLYLSRKRRDVQVVSCILCLSWYVTESTSREGTWVVMTSGCYLCPIVIKVRLCLENAVKIAWRTSIVRNRDVPRDRDKALRCHSLWWIFWNGIKNVCSLVRSTRCLYEIYGTGIQPRGHLLPWWEGDIWFRALK